MITSRRNLNSKSYINRKDDSVFLYKVNKNIYHIDYGLSIFLTLRYFAKFNVMCS